MKINSTRISMAVLAFTGSSLLGHAQHGDQRGGDAPLNDECTGATEQDLFAGETILLTGNNTGANVIEGTTFVVVWEAFTLDACATIQIDHCVSGSLFESFLNTITSTCPDIQAGLVTANEIGSCQVTYHELGPGTWYIPVLADTTLTPMGDYTIQVTAMECDPLYCSAEGESQEITGTLIGVGLGGLNYAGPSLAQGYIDNTMEVAYVGTGQDYALSITVDDMNVMGDIPESAQLLVWIDFDQNGDFTDPGELVYISGDPFAGTIHTGTISIPNTATLGATRMRIRLHDMHDGSEYENESNTTPCGASTHGQVLDLTVNIDLGTTVRTIDSDGWSLYPNPSEGEITLITTGVSGSTLIEVLDLTGRIVHARQATVHQGEAVFLNFSGIVPSGGYLLQITNGEHRSTRPFVIL